MEGAAPKMTTTKQSAYDYIGGDAVIRRLVDCFYDYMDRLPEVATLRAMHPADLAESRDKLYWFMTGWLGGPQMFMERRGHPRLRARHMPFAVDTAARDAWMLCMRKAVADVITIPDANEYLIEPLARLADHMRNQPEPEPSI